MHAFALDTLGQPGSLRELPEPQPGPGEVLVRTRAAGVNPFDAAVAQGWLESYMEHRFPLVLGMDAAGVVEALGDGVAGFALGDEVLGGVGKPFVGGGTYAEAVTMATSSIVAKPAGFGFDLAAALPLAGSTAITLLDAVSLAAGETVLVLGASGGVGSFLVQLAKQAGASVVGVCSGPNADYARERGADDVIDYASQDVATTLGERYPDGIDAIVDLVGDGAALLGLSEQLRQGGRVASAVSAADEAKLAERGIRAANVGTVITAAMLDRLVAGLQDGSLKPPEVASLPLAGAAEALAAIGTKHTRGKLVLAVG
jgi:NADPH:quinone reductase-like Zn-dependent oxidoreductase